MVFDIIILIMFVTVFITGYIRGAGIELLRCLKLIIPFIILYYFGDVIVSTLFNSNRINYFVYKILPDIPFKSTISSLSTHLLLYILVYIFLAFILWRLGSLVLDERIEYFFGRTNAVMGGFFSVIWLYVIVSYLIIPFYVLNFTSQDDFTTNFILNNPPAFSRIGRFIHRSKPTLDQMNEMTDAFQVMDLDSFNNYALFLTDVEAFIVELEHKADRVYDALLEEGKLPEGVSRDQFLYELTIHPNYRSISLDDREAQTIKEDLEDEIEQYQSVIRWAYEENVLELETLDEVVASFIENYDNIAFNTNDPLTVELLAQSKTMTQVYLTMTSFLEESIGIEVKTTKDLLKDENLVALFENYDYFEEDLLKQIDELPKFSEAHREWFKQQVIRFGAFQQKYKTVYKDYIELYGPLLPDVSFKYKLMFAMMKAEGFHDTLYKQLEENPTLYFFILDAIPFLDQVDQNEDIYYQVGQVYVALFLLDIDQETSEPTIVPQRLLDHIHKYRFLQNQYSDLNLVMNDVIHALLVNRDGGSYVEYLIDEGYLSLDVLETFYQDKDVRALLTQRNRAYFNDLFEQRKPGVA